MRRLLLMLVVLSMVVWGVAKAAQLSLPGLGAPAATPTAEPMVDEAEAERCPPQSFTPVPGSAEGTGQPAETGSIGPPEKDVVPGTDPTLSPEQRRQLEKGVEETYLPGPPLPETTPVVGPTPGTESSPNGGNSNRCP